MAKKPLIEEIQEFRKSKRKLIPTLIILGVLGLFLPILPGLAFIFLGVLLLFPQQSEGLLKKFRQAFRTE